MKEDTKTRFFNQSAKIVKDYKNTERKPLLFLKILKIFYRHLLFKELSPDKINQGVNCYWHVFDDETTKFKLKFIGRENITTKFGLYLQWYLDH
jgi:hypothetical protein